MTDVKSRRAYSPKWQLEMSFKVNLYNPQGQAYAPRISHEDWEKHKPIISHLHSIKTPRKVMLIQLRKEYNFTPTLGQLQAKCKEWNLKVYAKENCTERPPAINVQFSPSPITTANKSPSAPAFHLAAESGFVEAWSNDYRVHPSASANCLRQDQGLGLPPEYIGGGLLANSADSSWPMPHDERQCAAMLRAAHFYYSCSFWQSAWSIYRAIFRWRRLTTQSICDERVIDIILHCACSAVTDHQRNIMHSVLCEVGSSPDIDSLSSEAISLLEHASLSMIPSDVSCDVESSDLLKARAIAYLRSFSSTESHSTESTFTRDAQATVYRFEHEFLMHEHDTKTLLSLLSWCETVIEKLQREVDDIFVGHTRCEDEYHRIVSQVLSGHLLSAWHKPPQDDDQRTRLMHICSTQFNLTTTCTTQTLVALAFIIVDAALVSNSTTVSSNSTNLWFADAAKLFKRGVRMLCRLDERSRCAVFMDAYLERFYTPVSSRQKACEWTAQLPAIVDSVGISFAQDSMWLHESSTVDGQHMPAASLPHAASLSMQTDPGVVPDLHGVDPPILNDVAMLDNAFPNSESNSIASFIDTYQRALKSKFDLKIKSGRSTPGDIMSLTSSTEFKFGLVNNCNASTLSAALAPTLL